MRDYFIEDLGVEFSFSGLCFYVSNGLGKPLLRELYFTFLFLNTFIVQVSKYRLDYESYACQQLF